MEGEGGVGGREGEGGERVGRGRGRGCINPEIQ